MPFPLFFCNCVETDSKIWYYEFIIILMEEYVWI